MLRLLQGIPKCYLHSISTAFQSNCPSIYHSNDTVNNSTSSIDYAAKVIGWLTYGIGLPAIGLAIFALKKMSKGENKIPIYVICLLVSDIMSFLGRSNAVSDSVISSDTTTLIFYFGLVSNITFMSCIAQERHLQMAYPQYIGCFTRLKHSTIISLGIWAAPFAVLTLAILQYYFWFAVAMLAPFPFLLFFAMDSWRALHCCQSSPMTAEKRRTAWGQVVILTNYTLIHLPFILTILLESLALTKEVPYLSLASHLMLYLSPLVDPFIYVLMTKGPREVLALLPCCNKSRPAEKATSPTVDTVAEAVETRL